MKDLQCRCRQSNRLQLSSYLVLTKPISPIFLIATTYLISEFFPQRFQLFPSSFSYRFLASQEQINRLVFLIVLLMFTVLGNSCPHIFAYFMFHIRIGLRVKYLESFTLLLIQNNTNSQTFNLGLHDIPLVGFNNVHDMPLDGFKLDKPVIFYE